MALVTGSKEAECVQVCLVYTTCLAESAQEVTGVYLPQEVTGVYWPQGVMEVYWP